MFLQLHDELPYASTVETEQWDERPDGSVRIEQVVYVQRPGQRAIVLGEGGQRIKAIGARARGRARSACSNAACTSSCSSRCGENWSEDRARFRALGLDYDV